MSENPYAPPSAEVQDVPAATALGDPPLFPVSLTKLLVMSICTVGLYQIYWFYVNWVRIKRMNQSGILPAARAFFGVIFCYSCFSEIRALGERAGIQSSPAAGLLAIGWILCTFTWKLPDPFWLMAFGTVIFLLPIQNYANAVNQAMAPGHDPNSKLTVRNWAAIIPGGLLVLLAVVGLALPE